MNEFGLSRVVDVEALRAFDRPVYFALGRLSNPDYYGRMAERLVAIFPEFTIETFSERHHFDPRHRVEPDPRWLLRSRALGRCGDRPHRRRRVPWCRSGADSPQSLHAGTQSLRAKGGVRHAYSRSAYCGRGSVRWAAKEDETMSDVAVRGAAV